MHRGSSPGPHTEEQRAAAHQQQCGRVARRAHELERLLAQRHRLRRLVCAAAGGDDGTAAAGAGTTTAAALRGLPHLLRSLHLPLVQPRHLVRLGRVAAAALPEQLPPVLLEDPARGRRERWLGRAPAGLIFEPQLGGRSGQVGSPQRLARVAQLRLRHPVHLHQRADLVRLGRTIAVGAAFRAARALGRRRRCAHTTVEGGGWGAEGT